MSNIPPELFGAPVDKGTRLLVAYLWTISVVDSETHEHVAAPRISDASRALSQARSSTRRQMRAAETANLVEEGAITIFGREVRGWKLIRETLLNGSPVSDDVEGFLDDDSTSGVFRLGGGNG